MAHNRRRLAPVAMSKSMRVVASAEAMDSKRWSYSPVCQREVRLFKFDALCPTITRPPRRQAAVTERESFVLLPNNCSTTMNALVYLPHFHHRFEHRRAAQAGGDQNRRSPAHRRVTFTTCGHSVTAPSESTYLLTGKIVNHRRCSACGNTWDTFVDPRPAIGRELSPTFTYLVVDGPKSAWRELFPARRGRDYLGFFLFRLLGFAIATLLSLGHVVHLLLGFEFVQFIRLQNAPARRADANIRVTVAQQLSCETQCDGRAVAAEIGAAILVGPRDQVRHTRCLSHGASPQHRPEAKQTVERSPAGRSIPRRENATSDAPATLSAGAHMTLSHRSMPLKGAVMQRCYACGTPIASTKTSRMGQGRAAGSAVRDGECAGYCRTMGAWSRCRSVGASCKKR
jgi:hypothetical protein